MEYCISLQFTSFAIDKHGIKLTSTTIFNRSKLDIFSCIHIIEEIREDNNKFLRFHGHYQGLFYLCRGTHGQLFAPVSMGLQRRRNGISKRYSRYVPYM